jgi:predicted unusual protein kinase regulating ubiquinone biosynthesis (AarF/ABC1/UbiB family)
VLTTERVRGVKIDAISPFTRLERDLAPVADELTRAYLKQITLDGHFHADPHPGNVFVVLPESDNPLTPSELRARDPLAVQREVVTPLAEIDRQAEENAAPPPRERGVRLALIDFGMTARLSTSLRAQIVRLLLDLADNQGDDAAATMIEIGHALPDFDRPAFVHDVASLLARNYDLAVGEIQAGQVLFEVIDIAYQRGLRLPAELTLLAKALFNLDAVTRALDPTYSPVETIREFGAQIAADRARRELSPRRLFQLATEGSNLLTALPHRLDIITDRLASNELATRVDVPQVAQLTEALQKVANRIFSGAVLAGLLVASGMLLPYRPSLGTAGFVLAGAIGLWMVLSILWSDRQRAAREKREP